MAIKKMQLSGARQAVGKVGLSCRVTSTDPLIRSGVHVESTGGDSSRFTSAQLTPGPATRSLRPQSSYVLEWTIAFGRAGSATLHVEVEFADGSTVRLSPMRVEGEAGQEKRRVVLLP